MNNILKKTFKYALNFIKILSIVLFISRVGYAEEGSHVWTSIGPEGGEVRHITVSPSHPDIMYATVHGNSNQYLIKSENGGESWNEVFTQRAYSTFDDGEPFFEDFEFRVSFFVVDSVNPEVLYSVDFSSLIKSSDGGQHWYSIDHDLDIDAQSQSFAIFNTVADSQPLKIIVHGEEWGERYIAVSHDAGEHWVVPEAPIGRVSTNAITIQAVSQSNPDVMYGTTFDDSNYRELLHKSVDGGLSWSKVTELPNMMQYDFEFMIHPKNNEKLFLRYTSQLEYEITPERIVIFSNNGGDSWERLAAPNQATEIGQLFLDPTDVNILYAYYLQFEDHSGSFLSTPSSIQVTKSIDSGKTWQVIDQVKVIESDEYGYGGMFIKSYFSQLIVSPLNNNKILRSTSQGILRSENGGFDWHSSNVGLRFIGTNNFSVANDDSSVIYALASEIFYKSSNGGKHWEIVESIDSMINSCEQFVINPKNSKNILCINNNSLYESNDSGVHWLLLYEDVNLVVYANDGKTLYMCMEFNNKLYKKVANSDQLLDISISSVYSLSVIKLLVDPDDSNTLYSLAANEGDITTSVYKSTDSGLHWIKQVSIGELNYSEDLIMHPSYQIA